MFCALSLVLIAVYTAVLYLVSKLEVVPNNPTDEP